MACGAAPGTRGSAPPPESDTASSSSTPFTFTVPDPSCEIHDNQPCFDDGTYHRSDDGCTCVSDQLTCGDDNGQLPCVEYDPDTSTGGAITACGNGGTLVAGPNAEGTWYAFRFDAAGMLIGRSFGGPCGSMVICACCDGVVLDTVVEGNFAPCD